MSSLRQLEKEARSRRLQFENTLHDLQVRTTLPELANEALGLIDPRFKRLEPVYSAVKRHPLLAISALASASWLFGQTLQVKNHTRIHSPKTPAVKKETNHEIQHSNFNHL